MPLAADERVHEAGTSLPRFRRMGLSSDSAKHIHAVLGKEGVRTVFSAIDGFNRAHIQGLLRAPGAWRLAHVEIFGLANRRWVRVVPSSESARAMLEARGITTAGRP